MGYVLDAPKQDKFIFEGSHRMACPPVWNLLQGLFRVNKLPPQKGHIQAPQILELLIKVRASEQVETIPDDL